MLERDLQDLVIQLVRAKGLLVYHTHDSRHSAAGFLDLVIVGANGVLYRELKTEKGTLSPDQRHWLAALTAAGQDAGVWRPSDWPQKVLADLAPLRRLDVARSAPTQAELRRRLARRGARKVPSAGTVSPESR